jgi:hypothetical protein
MKFTYIDVSCSRCKLNGGICPVRSQYETEEEKIKEYEDLSLYEKIKRREPTHNTVLFEAGRCNLLTVFKEELKR